MAAPLDLEYYAFIFLVAAGCLALAYGATRLIWKRVTPRLYGCGLMGCGAAVGGGALCIARAASSQQAPWEGWSLFVNLLAGGSIALVMSGLGLVIFSIAFIREKLKKSA